MLVPRKQNCPQSHHWLLAGLWEAMGVVGPSGSLEGTPRDESAGAEGGAGGGGVPRPSLTAINQVFAELEQPENATFKDPLTPELMQARLLKMELSRNMKIPSRLEFDDKTMRTLRQYSSPPPAVHDVVVAFFLIFGEYEGFTRVSWTVLYIVCIQYTNIGKKISITQFRTSN